MQRRLVGWDMSTKINAIDIGGQREEVEIGGIRDCLWREVVEIGGWTKDVKNFMLAKINVAKISGMRYICWNHCRKY